MFAAAKGHSTLGIPESVGKEFVGKDEADMTEADWIKLRDLFVKWLGEESAEDCVAQDAALALDYSSVRSTDADGRLHVELTPISKANVCPYWGYEIPDGDKIGLQPDKQYRLLRHPDELAKAAPTFNGLPLLIKHTPVSADDHQPDLVVGSTGTHAVFEAPYLKNGLVVWAQDAIDLITAGKQKELSCGYRYTVDMTPGVHNDEPYDGVMRNIIGNHVALVEAGRAGPDVVIGDAALVEGNRPNQGEVLMTKKVLTRKGAMVAGALTAFLRPKLATDAKPVDLTEVLAPVTAANIKNHKAAIVAAVTKDAKLAKDQSLTDLGPLLDYLATSVIAEDEADKDDEDKKAKDMKAEDDKEDGSAADEMDPEAMDEFPPDDDDDEEKKKAKDIKAKDKKAKDMKAKDDAPEMKPKGIDKKAMDAAIASAKSETKAEMLAIATAREYVQPWVGKLSLALDSVPAVYKAALETLGIDTKNKHPDALKDILEAQPKPGERGRSTTIAQDASSGAGFNERWGKDTDRIGVA